MELVKFTRCPSHRGERPCRKGDAFALFHASRAGRADLLARMELKGREVERRDERGNTALHHAARSDRLDTLKLLLSRGASVNVRNAAGYTPVHLAAR